MDFILSLRPGGGPTALFASLIAFFVWSVGLFVMGRKDGRVVERVRQSEQRLKDVKQAQKVYDEMEILDDVGLADRASRWMRDNK
jgi:Tfp pilus assembly protein PilV